MEELVKVKNKIRNFIRNFDDIIIPILRLIWSYAVFSVINIHFGYVDLFNRHMVVLLISILCALMPDAFMLFVIGVIMGVNSFSVGIETGLFFIVLFIGMYCVYLRFFPKHLYIILVAFVAMHLAMSGLLPLFIGVIAGIAGIVPAAFGIVLYYYSDVLKDLDTMIKYSSEPDKVESFNYLKDYFKDNKDLLTIIGAFAITIFVTGILYRLSFKYAVYIAIGVGAIMNLISFNIVSKRLHTTVDMNSIFMTTVISLIFVLAFQFCKGFVDYRKTERVQFEDDEYYYYVKAVPKFGEDIDKAARRRTVKRKAGVVLSDKAVQQRSRQNGENPAKKGAPAPRVKRPGVQPQLTKNEAEGDKAIADALKVAENVSKETGSADSARKALEMADKTVTASQAKPSGSGQQKPSGSGQPKSVGSNQARPAGSGQPKPAGSRQARPAGSSQAKPAGSSQAKPAGSGQARPAAGGQKKPAPVQKTAARVEKDDAPSGFVRKSLPGDEKKDSDKE